jgi:hypothetical protein
LLPPTFAFLASSAAKYVCTKYTPWPINFLLNTSLDLLQSPESLYEPIKGREIAQKLLYPVAGSILGSCFGAKNTPTLKIANQDLQATQL